MKYSVTIVLNVIEKRPLLGQFHVDSGRIERVILRSRRGNLRQSQGRWQVILNAAASKVSWLRTDTLRYISPELHAFNAAYARLARFQPASAKDGAVPSIARKESVCFRKMMGRPHLDRTPRA